MNISRLFSKPVFRWVAWLLAVSFFFYEFLLRVSPSVMLDSLRGTFDADAAAISAVLASYYYAYAPMQLLVGMLMDRYGPRHLLFAATGICGLSALAFGLSPNLEILALTRFLTGFGSAFAFVGLLFLTAHWFPHKRLALLIGIANSVAMIGAFAGEGPISLIEDVIGWRNTMVALGIIGLLLAILLLLLRKAPKRKKDTTSSFLGAWKNLLGVLAHPSSWLNAGVAVFIYATTSGFAALWGVSFLMNNHHMSRDQAGFCTSMIYIGWLIGGPIIGHLSDKLGKRRPFILGCALLGGLTMLPLVLLTDLSTLTIYILITLVGVFSTAELLNFSYAVDLHQNKATGSALAFTNFVIMLGGAIFQPLVGWLLDAFTTSIYANGATTYSQTDYKIAMLVFPISFFIAFILALFLKEK